MRLFFCISLILLSFSILHSQKPEIDYGLIAYYPLDGDATDELDNIYDGITYNTTITKNRFGEKNKAIYFNGKSYIDLGIDFPSLGGTKIFSVSVWFKTVSPGVIISRWDRAVQGEFSLSVSSKGNVLFHREVDPWYCTGINKFDDNEWHHFVAVYNGKKNLTYIDGRLECSSDFGKCSIADNTQLLIGTTKGNGKIHFYPSAEYEEKVLGSMVPFKGSIDELRIYGRALDKSEVVKLFKQE